MPPSALRLMIVQLAVHSTFRARPTRQLLVGQMDVDLSVGQLQLNRLDVPRRLDPENALIKVSILHSGIVSRPSPQLPRLHYKAGIPIYFPIRKEAWRRIASLPPPGSFLDENMLPWASLSAAPLE